jgi:uncharacterized protein (DUF1800 family)
MDKLVEILAGQGLAGAMLVMLILAVKYLQGKRDDDGEARLADSRDMLKTQHEMNLAVGKMTDAVVGLKEALTSLTITVQNSHSENKTALEVTRERDNRVERMIEANGEVIRSTQECIRHMKAAVSELAKTADDRGR